MTTLLLLVIYIAFISLGIPDSLFGTAWPAIYSELTLPISYGSFVTIIISCGTIIFQSFKFTVACSIWNWIYLYIQHGINGNCVVAIFLF